MVHHHATIHFSKVMFLSHTQISAA